MGYKDLCVRNVWIGMFGGQEREESYVCVVCMYGVSGV